MVLRLSSLAAPFRKVASLYSSSVAKRPLLTNAALGFVIASTGDFVCQHFFEEGEYDVRRTIHMGLIRAVVIAPFLHGYFPFLARLAPGQSFKSAALRVCADQIIGSPVSITLTFAVVSALKGEPMSFFPRVKEQLIPTMKAGIMYWPFVHTLNFRFVPLSHQPIVAHVAALWWNAILSYRANTALRGTELDEEDDKQSQDVASASVGVPLDTLASETSSVPPSEPILLTNQKPISAVET